MNRILILLIPLLITYNSFSQQKPKLVVGIVVDQLRYDYIYRFWDKYDDDGFKKIINDGHFYRNCQFGYAPTYTGPGHASIYTGTTPSNHGIIANNWFDRKSGKSIYCAGDGDMHTVCNCEQISIDIQSDDGKMSPHHMLTTTFSDEWQCIKSCNAQNPKQRLIAFNKFLQCTYFDLFKYCSYTLYVELSDPQEWDKYSGKYPRFHLHGTITMPDAVEELLYFKLNTPSLISQYGRVQINNLRPDWKDYCTKDQQLYGTWLRCYNSMDKLIANAKVKKPKEPYDFFKPSV